MNLAEYKAALEKRIKIAEAASPGPWDMDSSGDINGPEREIAFKTALTNHINNGEFIAQAGTHYLADLKALLAAVEALERIATQDYRGNGEPGMWWARAALEKITGEE